MNSRAAQAVVLPLELGLSLAQTAKAIGRSVRTCNLRTRYCQVARHEREAPRPKRMLRNRANATLDREAQILDEVLENAMRGVSSSFHRSRGDRKTIRQAGGAIDDLSHAGAQWLAEARTGYRPSARRRFGPRGLEKKLQGKLGEIVASWRNGRPLRLMFQDEARFTHLDTRSLVPPPGAATRQSHGDAAIHLRLWRGESAGRCFDSLVLPHVKDQECMQIFVDEIARRHPDDNVVMVLDGAGWHKSKDFHLPENLRLLFLPPYSPELNPQEHLWDELREKYFHNRVFDSIDALEDHLVAALLNLENAPARVKGITARDWIINAMSIAN